MKNKFSFLSWILISAVLLYYRISYSDIKSPHPLRITTWDALGYYIYLPSIFIYHDIKQLKWFPTVDSQYAVSGGWFYQATKYKNGNYVFKYLGGVSVLESPLFFVGHFITKHSRYNADGFSPPYQYAIAFGVLFYCVLAIFLLRRILLFYFSDTIVGWTLLLLLLASNFIQYVSIDSAQSHAFIFPLYVLILYTTIKWHERPRLIWASLIGYIIGLASISRPTEAVMLFIPLLWNTHTKESSQEKWNLWKKNKKHILSAVLFCLIGVLPQLIYWKIASGSFVYDVGSKWDFLNPHWRVLIGWEKGWFIYTPVAIFFVAGLFFIRKFPFKNSTLWFCLLNIYIIISWHIWRYGGSYSCRALVQSYPVFALPLAALIERIAGRKGRYLFYVLGIYLVYVNLFQITQLNNTVLHYDDMNRKYYASIYLNSHPSPLDMSLLDTDEMLADETKYYKEVMVSSDSLVLIHLPPPFLKGATVRRLLAEFPLTNIQKDDWIKVESFIQVRNNFYGSYLNAELQSGNFFKRTKIRLFSPISQNGQMNEYAFYMKMPSDIQQGDFRLCIFSSKEFDGTVKSVKITYLRKK